MSDVTPKDAANTAHYLVIGDEFDEALPLLDFAIREWKGNGDGLYMAYWDRGIAQNCIGMHLEAVADFTRAIELDGSGYLFHARGIAFRNLGDYSAALRDFTIAFDKIPGDDWTVMFLSQLLCCSPNDHDRHGEHARRLAQLLDEACPEVDDLLSSVCAELGEWSEAMRLQRAIHQWWTDSDDGRRENGMALASNRLELFSTQTAVRLGVNDCDTWYQSFCE